MAALTKDRITRQRGRSPMTTALPVAAGAVIFNGGMVSLNAAGYAKAATDTVGETFAGVAKFAVDNTGGSDGDCEIQVESESDFEFELSGVTVANHGEDLTVSDDQTVSTGGNVSVGRLANIDERTGLAWVRTRQGGA